jgi:branched-chain amino acid aminotransferase
MAGATEAQGEGPIEGTFEPVDLPVPTPGPEIERLCEDPGFGRIFSDHMVTMRWEASRGWYDGRLTARRPLPFDPASLVFHYGQAIFEGLKAYHQAEGGVAMFRPHDNARRFRASSRRMAMAELPEGYFVEALQQLVRADLSWVPAGEGKSLYLRPFMVATEVGIGIRPSSEYLFCVLASPSQSIFSCESDAITVWLSHEYVRAAPGGTGAAKTAGNYAGSLLAQRQAAEKGCDQVVWLDAVERRFVEEMGGMNLCFVFDDGGGAPPRIVTPELTGTLLAGVTRDSMLTLAADLGYGASEERVDIEQWEKGCAEGTITEVFACGTAAVVTPVGQVRHAGGGWTIGDGGIGPVTLRMHDALLDVQRGRVPDRHGWMTRIV